MEFSELATLLTKQAGLRKKMDDAELDKRVAERSGDAQAIEQATNDWRAALNEWHGSYEDCRITARQLCQEHGITTDQLRSAT